MLPSSLSTTKGLNNARKTVQNSNPYYHTDEEAMYAILYVEHTNAVTCEIMRRYVIDTRLWLLVYV